MDSSSKKRKRKSKKLESSPVKLSKTTDESGEEAEEQNNEELIFPPVFEDNVAEISIEWSPEDLNTLIELVEKTVPQNDKSKYKTAVNKINWSEINVGIHLGEDCKKKWHEIMDRVRKFRTLREICEDAKEWTKKPWGNYNKKPRHPDLPKKPLTAFLRFYVEKMKPLRQKNPSRPLSELAAELSQKYKNLSEKKRKKYTDAYEKEMDDWRQQMEKFKADHPGVALTERSVEGPEKPISPFGFFKLKRMKKFEKTVSKKIILETLRKEWSDLSTKRKCKFIEKALKDEKRYQSEAEVYKSTHPNYVIITKSSVSRAELEMLKTRDGKPEKPPASGYALFSKIMLKEVKDCPSKQKMSLIAQRWKALSEAERADYNFKAAKQTARYVDKFQQYLDGLNDEDREKEISDSRMKLPSDKKLRHTLEEVVEVDSTTRTVGSEENESDDSN